MPLSWTTTGPEVLLELEGAAARGVRARLEEALRAAVRSGRLEAGARLPSTRTLAGDLQVSRGLVVEVYSQLVAEGYLTARQGSGTHVAAGMGRAVPAAAAGPPGASLRWNFRPSLPDPASFPRQEWLRALRRALARIPDAALGLPEVRGHEALRRELAGYLARVRGVVADPERIVVCLGFSQAAGLIARALVGAGTVRVAIEDPGYPLQASHLEAGGASVTRVPVDDRGLVIDALVRSRAGAVVATPAHQFPTGVALAPERRSQLVAWARDGRWVVEDDYDAEFRYDRSAIGALQGLAPDRIVYVGTASKTLSPALRLAWMVVPEQLAGGVVEAKMLADRGSPVLDQLALAELIAHGAYDRHLRRMRRHYRARRDVLAAALRRRLPEAAVSGLAAGLQLVVRLPPGLVEAEVVEAAAAHGVGVQGLAALHSRPDCPPGLVLGYGLVPGPAIDDGIAQLAVAVGRAGG